MDDNLIIKQLAEYNEHTTKEYFYYYCRKADEIFNHKYQLKNKIGLDFYSLAHEYYIHLMTHDFKPLLDRPANVKLSTWMTNGFHFVILDALKAYNKEFANLSDTASDDILEYIRSGEPEDNMMQQVCEAISRHYMNDRMMQEIGSMIFYAGFSQKEIAAQLGITPAAINQRYKKMMNEVVTPYIIENYAQGTYDIKYDATTAYHEFNETAAVYEAAPKFSFRKKFLSFCTMPKKQYRTTPNHISSLQPGEIFVFGSNLMGAHAGGAAYAAYKHFGAVWGNGVGLQGQSYAIPTMQGGIETIKPYVDEFIEFAKQHQELRFLVTPVGCGIAGFEPCDIAPLFKDATDVENVYLPESFWDILR